MGKDQELLEAARNGNVAIVEKILGQRAKRSGPLASLRRGPGANVQDSSGYSALHHAALNGHKEVVRLLLAYEASTNIVDGKGSSPLHLAAWTGNVNIVRLLLCHGPSVPNVNLTTKDNETALHSAAQYGHAAVVAQLLEHGCDPSIRNSREETALDLAAQYGRRETVELLVRTHPELIESMRRAVPGIVFPHTPLHLASRNGHKHVVEILLSAGFDVNIRTPAGTALHEAALCGKVDVVRTLLDHGVDLNVRDSHHNTVMDLLGQFPAHVTQDITNIIRRHSGVDYSDVESISQSLPPIPVPDSALGSPYENVRPFSRTRDDSSSSSHRWDYYRQSKSVDDALEDRRRSGNSALSLRRIKSFLRNFHVSKSHSSSHLPVNKKSRTNKHMNSNSTSSFSSVSSSTSNSISYLFSQQCASNAYSYGFSRDNSLNNSFSSYTTPSNDLGHARNFQSNTLAYSGRCYQSSALNPGISDESIISNNSICKVDPSKGESVECNQNITKHESGKNSKEKETLTLSINGNCTTTTVTIEIENKEPNNNRSLADEFINEVFDSLCDEFNKDQVDKSYKPNNMPNIPEHPDIQTQSDATAYIKDTDDVNNNLHTEHLAQDNESREQQGKIASQASKVHLNRSASVKYSRNSEKTQKNGTNLSKNTSLPCLTAIKDVYVFNTNRTDSNETIIPDIPHLDQIHQANQLGIPVDCDNNTESNLDNQSVVSEYLPEHILKRKKFGSTGDFVEEERRISGIFSSLKTINFNENYTKEILTYENIIIKDSSQSDKAAKVINRLRYPPPIPTPRLSIKSKPHNHPHYSNGYHRTNNSSLLPLSYRSSDNSFYPNPPVPKSFMDPPSYYQSSEEYSYKLRAADSDQLSISSTSSVGGPSPRERLPRESHYLPMTPRSSAHSPGSNNKVSPTPPKKPPRRNLSISPTHLTPMSLSIDGNSVANNQSYEYLFLARSGARSQNDLDDITPPRRRVGDALYHGKSVDTYVAMNKRYSVAPNDLHRRRSEELLDNDDTTKKKDPRRGRKHFSSYNTDEEDHRNYENQYPPVAITAIHENIPIKTQNPRRKLRRHNNVYETTQLRDRVATNSVPNLIENMRMSAFTPPRTYSQLKSSEESLLDERKVEMDDTPLSPTHYNQPPTPDHPPPSAKQAEISILERIRPLSQEYNKRRSRDIETETDDDMLTYPLLDESSGSFSSSFSLSDRSVSTDNNVEEYVCDVPFAGLFKGSTTALEGIGVPLRPVPAERPKTLKRLKNVYDNNITNGNDFHTNHYQKSKDHSPMDVFKVPPRQNEKANDEDDREQSLSILSPFDEQEEWAKVSEIVASFGSKLVRESVFVSDIEKEFQEKLGLRFGTVVGRWLDSIGQAKYESLFIKNGLDDVDFLNGVIDENDLKTIGVSNENDRQAIFEALKTLPLRIDNRLQNHNNNNHRNSIDAADDLVIDEKNDESSLEAVDNWLKSINLEQYKETFLKHLYTEMSKIHKIWEVELLAVLEINKLGHRKRILKSVAGNDFDSSGPNMGDINLDAYNVKSNKDRNNKPTETSTTPSKVQSIPKSQGGTNTGTLRHHKKNRPAPPPPNQPPKVIELEIRAPSELLVGVPSTLKTQWRHEPNKLITGCVTYIANYLGSTIVKELKGTESTRKSIQKLKKATTIENRPTPDIILAISFGGVKFLNSLTEEMICEHEIRNIHCACQDADDLTHFAYITKDHKTQDHFCHVFHVPTMDQATEIILTLGQAFEVAYQMVLRDQQTQANNRSSSNHLRSQSANQITPTFHSPSSLKNQPMSAAPVTHARSHSVNEIKLNGHQFSLPPPSSNSNDDFSRSSSNSDISRGKIV